jgi:hypothetical protein
MNASVGSSGNMPSLFRSLLRQSTELWQDGLLSNFDYLMHLNSLAGRSFNDLTQYPVYPWVLTRFDEEGPPSDAAAAAAAAAGGAAAPSDALRLNDVTWFRDLSKPMGALSKTRALEFRQRYADSDTPLLSDPSAMAPRFHYGTHYSSAAHALYYLIRLEPFTQFSVQQLQSGRFDRPDRLFNSIRQAWLSSARLSTSDVKELVPEFYFLPEFLRNGNRVSQLARTARPARPDPRRRGAAQLGHAAVGRAH